MVSVTPSVCRCRQSPPPVHVPEARSPWLLHDEQTRQRVNVQVDFILTRSKAEVPKTDEGMRSCPYVPIIPTYPSEIAHSCQIY